jgi:hypothetical protein
VGKLGGILARLDAANALLLQQLDSLAANPGGPVEISDDPGRGDRDAARHRPVSLEGIFAEVTKNNDAAGAEAVALLSGKSADRALKLISDQRRKMNKLLEDSGVRRGRGR